MADEQKESAKPAAVEEPTYHRDRLIAESDAFFGQPFYVVEAALSHGRLGQKVNFTKDEVKKAIKDYQDHEVAIDHPVPEAEEA